MLYGHWSMAFAGMDETFFLYLLVVNSTSGHDRGSVFFSPSNSILHSSCMDCGECLPSRAFFFSIKSQCTAISNNIFLIINCEYSPSCGLRRYNNTPHRTYQKKTEIFFTCHLRRKTKKYLSHFMKHQYLNCIFCFVRLVFTSRIFSCREERCVKCNTFT